MNHFAHKVLMGSKGRICYIFVLLAIFTFTSGYTPGFNWGCGKGPADEISPDEVGIEGETDVIATTPSDVPPDVAPTPTEDPGIAAREDCTTAEDDDADGLINCDDSDCAGHASCPTVATARCGNGTVDPGEACDDGNSDDTDACLNSCVAASCGDGFLQTGVEACDDGNTSDTDACLNTCAAARCGDHFVQAGVETCDDGNVLAEDGCDENCREEVAFIGTLRPPVSTLRPLALELRPPAPSPGMINVFFRRYASRVDQGRLCRVKGPPLRQWHSRAGVDAGYEWKCFQGIDIDRPPQVVFDETRRKLHVFAADHTGDGGGAHGYRYFICEANSIECTYQRFLLESKTHFYPALAFVKGADAAGDRIHGFVHGGYGGQLLHFVVDPNTGRLVLEEWLIGRMDQASKDSCGQHANIDKSPSLVIRERDERKELHLFARAGHGNPLHLYLEIPEFNKMASGADDYKFHCKKFEREGKPRFYGSPKAIVRDNNKIDIFGTHEQSPYLWPVTSLPTSSWGKAISLGGGSAYLAPEESLAVITASDDPNSDAHIFVNINNRTTHIQTSADGTLSTIKLFDFNLSGNPAAVSDSAGNIHLFGALDASLGGPSIHHFFLGPEGGANWRVEGIAPEQYVQSGDKGSPQSGVTAIWVPSPISSIEGL